MVNWQLDSSTNICSLCNTRFTFFNRRHHCRMCGKIVCNDCSRAKMNGLSPIRMSNGRWSHNPNTYQRVCRLCIVKKIRISDSLLIKVPTSAILFLKSMITAIDSAFPISPSKAWQLNVFDTALHKNINHYFKQNIPVMSCMRNGEIIGRNVFTNITRAEQIFMRCQKFGLANCHELSLFCFLFFIKHTQDISFIFKSIKVIAAVEDHVFFVVDIVGNQNEIISIVCDVWYKHIFNLTDLNYYYGYSVSKTIEHMSSELVYSFSPRSVSVEL